MLAGARRGLEAKLLPERHFPYHLLPFEPIYRRQWWKNVRWPLLAIRLVRDVRRLLDTLRPSVVIGTGGYASAPLVWAAARRRIPTAVLELNAYPGLAVRKLAGRVDEIWLGSPEARQHLRPAARTAIVDTGTPVAMPDPSVRESALDAFGLEPGKPVVLVSGGSQGAHTLNQSIARWLEGGNHSSYQLLWVTGRGTYDQFRQHHRPPAVRVIDFLDPMKLGYSVADIAITRAGMMTIAELCAWGIPSILVPLPTAAGDHQTANARAMEAHGAAKLIPQTSLTSDAIDEALTLVLGDPDRAASMRVAALARARPDALDLILDRFGILSG